MDKNQQFTQQMQMEHRDIWETFMLHLRYKQVEHIEIGSHKTLLLNNPDIIWVVYSGNAEVFSTKYEEGKPVGIRDYLFTRSAGNILLGNTPIEEDVVLLVNGEPGTQLLQLSSAILEESTRKNKDYQAILEFLIERWIYKLTESISETLIPSDHEILLPDSLTTIRQNEVFKPLKKLLWAKLKSGAGYLVDIPTFQLRPNEFMPLASCSWLTAETELTIETQGFAEFMRDGNVWTEISRFQRQVMNIFVEKYHVQHTLEKERLKEKRRANQAQLLVAMQHLAAPLQKNFADASISRTQQTDALLSACAMVADSMDMSVKSPPNYDAVKQLDVIKAIEYISRASGFRTRRVALRGEWWKQDSGSLVAFLEDSMQPVALIQVDSQSYHLIDPVQQTTTPVTASVSENLYQFAEMFYKPFPNQSLSLRDVVAFGMAGSRRDIGLIIGAGLIGGALQTVAPLLSQTIFDTVIPSGDKTGLLYIGLVLLGIAVGKMVLELSYLASMMRLENHFDARIQPALWDRLLDLPIDFFHQYSSGDLANRASSMSALKSIVTQAVLLTILPAIFSIINLAVLFYLSPTLALVAILLSLLSIGFTSIVGSRNIKLQRKIAEQEGNLTGHLLQLINGITKFRVASAESHVFASWAERFGKQRQLVMKSRTLQNLLTVFNAFYPVLTQVIVFTVLIVAVDNQISTGTFLAFNMTFAIFLQATLLLSAGMMSLLNIVPIYERARPILQALPETSLIKQDPGPLSGKIEVSHASFSYNETDPPVLEDVSLSIEPGQFIAIVGTSGSGKSTLMRLMLGFHQLSTGVIYFDGIDISNLDIKSVRRQIGVVLQNSQLMVGQDIFRNIVGNSGLVLDDAWEAAEMAGLADDIRMMPMGMATFVSGGGGTLSGGQRQRVLIARALVRKPRIIFFDEATSALDNQTQKIVSQSLEQLEATRIVIAHRLSTIINADKIIVMDNGCIIESGTYRELIALNGHFAELASRQQA